ncbi:MAG: BtrH N-terminal domain-containing protein [Oscillospiraceae bacterium]|nr:BtrH N-terminal domain-containing protein [Oscillospiraceae bacterium]
MNNNSKILPIKHPMITVYAHHAHFLSILPYDDATLPWVYNNYINVLRFLDHKMANFHLPGHDGFAPIEMCKRLSVQKIIRDDITTYFRSFVDFVVYHIEKGNYVISMLDHYCLPPSAHYNQNHFRHDVLIYGYDLEKRVFYTSDFYKDGIYSFEPIPFDCIEKGFSSIYEDQDYLYDMVYLFKIVLDGEFVVDIDTIARSIRAYMEKTPFDYWSLYKPVPQSDKIIFGAEIYSELEKDLVFIREKANAAEIDIRPFSVLQAHKKINKMRFEYLVKKGFLLYDVKELESLETLTAMLINLIIKYSIKIDSNIMDKAISVLKEINERDIYLCNELLRILSRG